MRLLIIVVVAAAVGVLSVIAMKEIDGPWSSADSTLRNALSGALAGIASVFVGSKLRRKD